MNFILRPVLAAFALFACAMPLPAADTPPPEVKNPPDVIPLDRFREIAPHPRLLADARRWEELRQLVRTEPRHVELLRLLRRSGDEILQLPPIVYQPKFAGDNILIRMREAELRIITLAMLYRLTEEKPYLDGARSNMQGLAETPWPLPHFLDPATACLTLSIGYDWLFDELTPAEREQYARKIEEEFLQITIRDEDRMGFLWADFNWNQICNTGLTFGALAVADLRPELAHHIVNRTLALIPRAAAAYAPDGVYPEGPGYWAYGTGYHVMLIEIMRSAFQASYGLDKFPGFLASASVVGQLTGPSGDIFNYFDNHPTIRTQNLVFWFARETGQPAMADAEWSRLTRQAGQNGPGHGAPLPLTMLWLADATPTGAADARPAPLHWRGEGHQPLAVLRSAWNDPDATWVAVKGGTPDYSHGHMDAGSFVLEAGGVRWAIDPEIEDYLEVRHRTGLTHAEFFSYAQDSARWNCFRLGPEGHNILRFDGARQNVAGHAEIAPLRENPDGGATAQVDLGPNYQGQAATVSREITLFADGSVVFTDDWSAPPDRAVEATSQWLTMATVAVEPGGLRLDQGGRTLHFRVAGDSAQVEVQDVAKLLTPKYDAPLPGATRIVLRARTPAGGKGSFQVTAALAPREAVR